ncbi:MAG: hypothetical protein OEY78_04465 [Gammaproteobacteria bacterium]|nr:hypothetical protein [Gammaproteobacteria bacterium]
MFKLFYLTLISLLISACMAASDHRKDVTDSQGDRLTVGKVQKEIRTGMSGSDVIRVLGSPNIVTTDDKRREVWVYDKISTESAYSESRGNIGVLVLGGDGGGLGGIGGGSGARSTTQRTLTVIIKFNSMGKVRDFSYHATRF